MSYRADKQMIDTHTDRYTDMGGDNTQRPVLKIGPDLCCHVASLGHNGLIVYGRNVAGVCPTLALSMHYHAHT